MLRKYLNILFILSAVFLSSCSTDPKPIEFEVDNCDYCKMTISDIRFGAELVTKKGRIYKFDDIVCLKGFILDETVEEDNIASNWLVDFAETKELIPAETSYLLLNEDLRSPMASNIASFKNEEDLKSYQNEFSGTILKWEEYLKMD